MDLFFLSGFALVSSPLKERSRLAILIASLCILVYDVLRLAIGGLEQPVFPRLVVGPGWLLPADLMVVIVVSCWHSSSQPTRDQRQMGHPSRVALITLIGLALGVGVEKTQVGQFPIVVARSSGPDQPSLNYLVYLPSGYYRSAQNWPLILVLHGSGLVGDVISQVRQSGLPQRLEEGLNVPFVVVAPQSPQQGWDLDSCISVIDDSVKRFRVDEDRVYLTGDSMGGYGVWALASAYPQRFAAIAPLCGGGDLAQVGRLQGVPTWAFHGGRDELVLPEESRRMVEALVRQGGEARLTIYPEIGHDLRRLTYSDPNLYDWFLDHNAHH